MVYTSDLSVFFSWSQHSVGKFWAKFEDDLDIQHLIEKNGRIQMKGLARLL
jgi:hypothetical protein